MEEEEEEKKKLKKNSIEKMLFVEREEKYSCRFNIYYTRIYVTANMYT